MKSMLNNKLGNYDYSNYSNSLRSNNKYSNNELEEAKNSVQHLGKGTSTKNGISGSSLSNTGNYRKQFKPQFDEMNKPGTGFSSRKEENYVVDNKPKMGSSTNIGGKFNFSHKYGTGNNNGIFSNNQPFNQNVNPNSNKIGTYTNSKLASNKQLSVKENRVNEFSENVNSKPYLINTNSIKQQNNQMKNNFSKQHQIQELDDNRPIKGGDTNIPEKEDEGERIECEYCERKFNPEAYEKHSKVCDKVFMKTRKAFDSKKTRIINSEHAQILKRQEIIEKKKGSVQVKQVKKAPKWQKQSEEFRAAMNCMKNYDPKLPLSKQVQTPSSSYDDYIHCTYCNRKYNQNAYDKHLNFCMRKAKESEIKPKGSISTKPNLNVKFRK